MIEIYCFCPWIDSDTSQTHTFAMEIVYVYHSGIAVRLSRCDLLFDYWEDSVDANHGFVHDCLLNESRPLYVFSSHFHADHFTTDIFSFTDRRENVRYQLSKDIKKRRGNRLKGLSCPLIFLKKAERYEDEFISVLACGSTDSGISFLIRAEGKTIFHAGDLNNWQWHFEELSDLERRNSQMAKNFESELLFIKEHAATVDVAAFPVDPRLGTEEDIFRGPRQFLDSVQVRTLCPIHFCSRTEILEPLKSLCQTKECRLLLPLARGQIFTL